MTIDQVQAWLFPFRGAFLQWGEALVILLLFFFWVRAAGRARTYRRACERRHDDLARVRSMLEEMAKAASTRQGAPALGTHASAPVVQSPGQQWPGAQ
jgi:hypothetical protein